ncbi:MAG: DNA primase [Alphaproteobacteria bacterium]|nr:DNA primase [Alphaproteobacteria bacterium]
MAYSGLNTVLSLMKERVNLSQIVRQDVNLQKKGREFVGHCPFHNEKTGSFFVNDDKGTFYCFGCGASGDIVEYLIRRNGIQFMQAVELLSEISGIKIPEKIQYGDDCINKQQSILLKIMEFFRNNLMMSNDAMEYCKKRGLVEEIIDKFAIGYAPKDSSSLLLSYLKEAKFSHDDILNSGVFLEKDGKLICRFRDRIMFPVLNKKGEPIAFGGRGIQKDATPKYINSPETAIFQKRETLYGYGMSVKNISKGTPFILVEGYMDVVMMNKYGFNTAVASMGTAFSSQHLAKLWKYSDEPIVCLDGDFAGYNAMVKIALLALSYLQPGKSLKFCRIPGDDDPDSFLKNHPKAEMEQLLSKSENLIDFLWGQFSKNFAEMPNKTPENIAKWKKEIFAYIDDIQNADIKALYKQDIKGRILALLGKGNKTNSYLSGYKKSLQVQVDKKEKMLLREAVLLYILISRPSVIPVVVEELASVEFSDKDFEHLRHCILENPDKQDFSDVGEVVSKIEQLANEFVSYSEMQDNDVISLWKDVFEFGVARKRVVDDLKVAKSECEASFDEITWNRFRALKLGFISSNNSEK